MVKALQEGKIYCARCDEEMKLVILPRYEFEEGITLHSLPGYKCSSCNKNFFTEEQAQEMAARTEELKGSIFSFKRKVLISGRSLVVGIPVELADHIHLKAGTAVKILPVSNDGFLVKKL